MKMRVLVLLVVLASPASAIAAGTERADEFQLGRAAMEAHNPGAAIAHFERAGTREARAWLAAALMMESRSPSDSYVERAFEAAARARAGQPERVRPREEIRAALRPGDMVIAFLVREHHAYAWAFDRDTLIGYPLPPSAAIATAVERANAYLAQKDRAGLRRIGEDLLPALLGPVLDRIPALTRVIFVMDGPLRQLSIGELPAGDGAPSLSQRLAVSAVDDGSLFDEVGRTPSQPQSPQSAWPMTTLLTGAILLGILLVAGVALRRRSSIA